MSWQDNDLFKGRPHKYVKRTGSPGNYKYWYKLPDGRIVADDDSAAHEHHGTDHSKLRAAAQKDHLRRLIAGRAHGHHSMSDQEMAAEVGTDKKQVAWNTSNMTQLARRKKGNPTLSREDGAKHGHDYEESHLHEGRHRPDHPDYSRHSGASEGSAATPARTETARPAASEPSDFTAKMRAGGFRAQTGGGYQKHVTGGSVLITETDDGFKIEGTDQEPKTARTVEHAIRIANQLGGKIEDAHAESRRQADAREAGEQPARSRAPRSRASSTSGGATTERVTGATPTPGGADRTETERAADREAGSRARAARAAAEATPAAAPAGPSAEAIARARARLSPAQVAQAREQAQEAAQRLAARQAHESVRESGPATPEAQELGASEPEFAAADRPVQEMLEAQRRGENPYLKRAQDIYHNIRGDLKAERKAVCDHVFSSLAALKAAGQPINEANLVNKYKELSGKRIRGISGIAEDFEKGTFMTMDEILNNHPVNVEVERMKRGYAAKQFARIKPFLKESFTSRNPSAPPPFPTWGDIKTWSEHGGTKPSWAGTTRTALPREVFDGAVKGADGKPQYPPAWMPIHLMPVWNYVAKKAINESANPYQTAAVGMNQRGMADVAGTGAQAQYQEGIIKSAIRKYVVMRGGAENLVDIPASKLAEAGLSHGDIFKAESDEDLQKIMTNKIVDPVGLLKFIKEEMEQPIQKSWALTVDFDKPAVSFRKSYVVHGDIRKSGSYDIRKAKIEKVRSLLREKSRS